MANQLGTHEKQLKNIEDRVGTGEKDDKTIWMHVQDAEVKFKESAAMSMVPQRSGQNRRLPVSSRR